MPLIVKRLACLLIFGLGPGVSGVWGFGVRVTSLGFGRTHAHHLHEIAGDLRVVFVLVPRFRVLAHLVRVEVLGFSD